MQLSHERIRRSDYKVSDRLTAREALNQVRAAANMPPIEDTGEAFTKRLRNERRIELAFEDHRFWDIRRWMDGDVVKISMGLKSPSEEVSTPIPAQKIQTRIWDRKMYLYPIAQTELYKNPNLTQNSGWEIILPPLPF